MQRLSHIVFMFLITVIPIVFFSTLFFYMPLTAMPVLPVLLVGWFFVVCVTWNVAADQFRSFILMQTACVIGFHIMASLIIAERYDELGAIDYGPDDTIYVNTAIDLAQNVQEQPLAIQANWKKLIYEYDFSLRGYSFLRAHLFVWLKPDFDLWYLAAVALNQIALCLLLISLYHAIRLRLHKVKLFPLLVVYACICMNLFIHSSQCLKDVVLTLFVSVACLNCVPRVVSGGKIRMRPLILLAFTLLGLLTFRAVYIVLPPLYFVLINFEMLKKNRYTYIVAALVFTVATFTFFYMHDFQIRDINLLDCVYGRSEFVLSSGGLARRIYTIPLIGPMLYYLLVPFPLFDFNVTPIRVGIMNLAWFMYLPFLILIIANLWGIARNRKSLPILVFAVIFLFITDLGGQILDDTSPRYKFALMPFLCVLAYDVISRRKTTDKISAIEAMQQCKTD